MYVKIVIKHNFALLFFILLVVIDKMMINDSLLCNYENQNK